MTTKLERARAHAPTGYPDADLQRLCLSNTRNNTAVFIESTATPPAESDENAFGIGNQERAEMGLAAVVGFVDACATDDCDAVSDMLCDLMHLLDRMPEYYGSFEGCLRRARASYEQEIHIPAKVRA